MTGETNVKDATPDQTETQNPPVTVMTAIST